MHGHCKRELLAYFALRRLQVVHLKELRRRLEEHEFAIARARARVLYYRLPWIDVYHEELVGRSEETLERVLEFLGVEPRADDLESSFVAVDDVPRAEVLENLDEVRAALEGTRFAWMASDPTPAAGPPTAFDATVRTPS
jgi:hypothetical protein